jgi:hypothetical protein
MLWLVGEPHERPHQLVVDAAALRALRVHGGRHVGVLVAELPHRPLEVAAGEEAQAREGSPQHVGRDLARKQELALGSSLTAPGARPLGAPRYGQ